MYNHFSNDLISSSEEINSRPILEEYLTPAKRGFVCIECNNGTGDDGTGAIIKDNKLKCGKCQHSFNNIDIIAHHLGLSTRGRDFVEVVRFGCELFGIDFSISNSTPQRHNPRKPVPAKVEKVEPFERLAEAQSNLEKFVQSQGGAWRSLSFETLKLMHAGFLKNIYFPAAKKKLPAVVILNDLGGVYFRSISGKFHKNNKPMATTTIFLPETDTFDIIITEGQINAASIFQAVFSTTNDSPKFAIMAGSGTGGENNVIYKLKELSTQGKKFRVILAYDNDSNGAGQNAANKLVSLLISSGYIACSVDVTQAPDTDLNDVLQQQGAATLAEMVNSAITLAQVIFSDIFAEIKKSALGENIFDYFSNHFKSDIAENEKFKDRKTGFENFDDKLKFFLPGIYVVSGLPALGKTSFCLQLLEQMAQNGDYCIFCSFEMSKKFLFSKIFAREVFRIESQKFGTVKFPLTSTQIFVNDINDFHQDAYQSAFNFFTTVTYPFHIWEETKPDVDNLIARLNNVCSVLDKPPVVCIDYLQLLGSGSDKPKAAIDDALQKFFNFRRETNTTFILISSLNRANYNTGANIAGLKESGGIEYSADGIFSLQYILDTRTAKDAEDAMKKIPREIQLKCLKYRYGSQFDIGFYYYPNADFFLPIDNDTYLSLCNSISDKTVAHSDNIALT